MRVSNSSRADGAGTIRSGRPISFKLAIGLAIVAASFATMIGLIVGRKGAVATDSARKAVHKSRVIAYSPRIEVDTSGLNAIVDALELWTPASSLREIAENWKFAVERSVAKLDGQLQSANLDPYDRIKITINKSTCFLSGGKPEEAYAILTRCREELEHAGDRAKGQGLYSLIYMQGIASLRRGENENCIMCRGESSCILPISAAAVHKNKAGSQGAIRHFSEYLQQFPNDLQVRWLLNLAHMTLGEYPEGVNPNYLVSIDRYLNSEFDIGRFRDIGHLVGVNRFNMAGGAIMEDFDNDGLLDLAVSSFDFQQQLSLYRNSGDGHFEERKEGTGVEEQWGGLTCVQTDYNNDGLMDIYIPRGAWLRKPIRPSLLRNDGGFHFTDVTQEAGLLDPVNSNAGMWADYDNDGWVDLFVACEHQASRLYRNLGHGEFEEVSAKAGLSPFRNMYTKGCAWVDYDNDDYPDLFITYLDAPAQLYHNQRNGSFKNVSLAAGLSGPVIGFSCWAWDYDNDGWMDIFATSYDKTVQDVVNGLTGKPHTRSPNKLYRNRGGRSFEDVTVKAGLDMVFSTMGSNFGDFDNDGYLDMYLGTGDPNFAMLVPNRMFKNVDGKRFSEITASSGTGHLQKGHGIACGDWDRDGNIDIFAQLGGIVKGDEFHNILFQNPGHDNRWLTVKLIGKQTNRAALGARIKVVTAGSSPLTIHRHVTSGSSFGANPTEQTIGLGKADRISELTIHWPTSGTTQTFRDLDVDQSIRITEFAEEFEKLDYKRLPVPQSEPLRR